VSHQLVVKASQRIGLPPALVSYICCLYIGGITNIRGGGTLNPLIHPTRDVRQHNPLSPPLFCTVMNCVLTRLDDHLGLEVEAEVCINHLAFVDNVALMSSSPEAMQRLLCELESNMREVGLSPNPAKSASLRIAVTGKGRERGSALQSHFSRWTCCPFPPLISLARTGTSASGWGPRSSAKIGLEVTRKLEKVIRQLTKAPLKPQQRLFILHIHQLTSVYHELVLSSYSMGLLRYLDVGPDRQFVGGYISLTMCRSRSFILGR